jgi:hypothetical protein
VPGEQQGGGDGGLRGERDSEGAVGHDGGHGSSIGGAAAPLERSRQSISREDEMRERIEHDLATHEMTVLHDDGLYRHLRFKQADGSSFYWYDVTTWPGALAITGDCGAFVFRRIEDMLTFFESSTERINPSYWAQKLVAPNGTRSVREYSEEIARKRVAEWLSDVREWDDLSDDDFASLKANVEDQILSREEMGWEDGCHGLLRDFEHGRRQIIDSWEWDLTEWDWQFLWCCWAIVKGVGQYRQATAKATA